MRKCIYHVAVSLDGFIAHTDGSIQGFSHDEKVTADYFAAMANYHTAIMGRHTYEFGYQYGLSPGANPYPHMQTYVFTQQTPPDSVDSSVHWLNKDTIESVEKLKADEGGPIYLCGGGRFAGSLYRAGLIDEVILKLNPITLCTGIPLFGSADAELQTWQLKDTKSYDCGVVLLHYQKPGDQ